MANWIEKHSINCIKCDKLVDERDCTPSKDGEGEICNECGQSVKLGSGRFVNRMPDLNSTKERKQMGKPFPKGNFTCPDCEGGF